MNALKNREEVEKRNAERIRREKRANMYLKIAFVLTWVVMIAGTVLYDYIAS